MPFFLYGDILHCKRENGLRRATFPSSWKSSQKSRKKPMVSSLPCALFSVQICGPIPRVHAKLSFSFRKRIVSAPAPLPLNITPKNPMRLPCGPMWTSAPTHCLSYHRPLHFPFCPIRTPLFILLTLLQSRLYAMAVMQRRISRPPVADVMQAEMGAILTGLFLHITSLDTVRCLYKRIVHHLVYTVNKEGCLCINESVTCGRTPT